ncbi:MAG: putative baseplate assembly protein [Cellulomonas sp.]|uniref:hypothetical protein n=1 Tax=Cellulomonas sp. TaxID=40001 RepID=UPI0019EB53CF|nr:hypothetical protein [Cellulomonas sp.]MBF0686746.1 putative baseplate assembly protein [Cellulomonas sp.]
MPTSYLCAAPARLQRLRALVAAGDPAAVNAIDHLVVVDGPGVPASLRQRVLLLALLSGNDVAGLTASAVRVTGGVRVLDPAVRWAAQLSTLDVDVVDDDLGPAQRAYLAALQTEHAADPDPDAWLAVMLEQYGDFSTYRLSLQEGTQPPAGFDPVLSEIDFSFKVECPSPFDCAPADELGGPPVDEPDLDYLSRDFPSFRRLMLDRLALLDPAAGDGEPAELRTTLVEVLAYAADQAAWFGDAVATEAYLGTARTRPAVRRHARLLDYPVHEGCNTRAFVQLRLAAGRSATGTQLRPGALLLTRLPDQGATVRLADLPDALTSAPQGFHVLEAPSTFSDAHQEIAIHTWGENSCRLPAGATDLWVVDDGRLMLAPGDLVALTQTRSPVTLLPQDADPELRHVVRLTDVGPPVTDPLLAGGTARNLRWDDDDALPFDLDVRVETSPVAAVDGNLVLVDHGLWVRGEPLEITAWGSGLRAALSRTDLVWACGPPPDGTSATRSVQQTPAEAFPVVTLQGEGEVWTPVQRDLLGATSSARSFVVEPEEDRRTGIRFGDDVLGRRPRDLLGFDADYRVGRPAAGRVGAGAIAHLVADPGTVGAALSAAVVAVGNPLPAVGGVEPESLGDVRRFAPVAFAVQQRAVTEADWVEVAQRHPGVQRAVAVRRWTGSWHTVYVTVDPVAGTEFDDLRTELAGWLERFRLAGYDLDVVAPTYVPLDIVLAVRLTPTAFGEDVQRDLAREFSTGVLPDGRLGFFHPDRFSFGDSVWLSQVVDRAVAVPGVASVDTVASDVGVRPTSRFTRWGAVQGAEFDEGRIAVSALEIARCDSDPSVPDRGRIAFDVRGGR